MNVNYALERGKHKSTRAVYLSEHYGAPILTTTNERRRHLIDLAEQLKVAIPNPIIVEELYKVPNHIENYIVDEADCVLEALISKQSMGHMSNPSAMFFTPNVKY